MSSNTSIGAFISICKAQIKFAIAGIKGEADPYPQYLTEAELTAKNAEIVTVGSVKTAIALDPAGVRVASGAASSAQGAKADTALQPAAIGTTVASLVGGKIPNTQLPDLAIVTHLGTVATEAAMLALIGQRGDWCIRSDSSTVFILIADTPSLIASWKAMSYPTAPVLSVNTKTGTVTLTAADVGAMQATTAALTTLLISMTGTQRASTAPAAVAAATSRAITDADHNTPIFATASPTFTLNTGLSASFFCQIFGVCSFLAGSGVTIVDQRTAGASTSFCTVCMSPVAGTYYVIGSKA